MRERLPRYSSPPPQVRKSPHRVKKGQKERLNTVFTKALAVLLRLQPTQGKVAVILEVGGVLDTFVSEEHPSWPPSRDEIYSKAGENIVHMPRDILPITQLAGMGFRESVSHECVESVTDNSSEYSQSNHASPYWTPEMQLCQGAGLGIMDGYEDQRCATPDQPGAQPHSRLGVGNGYGEDASGTEAGTLLSACQPDYGPPMPKNMVSSGLVLPPQTAASTSQGQGVPADNPPRRRKLFQRSVSKSVDGSME